MIKNALDLTGAPQGLDKDHILMYMFLTRFEGSTRQSYSIYIKSFYEWSCAYGISITEAKRVHLQFFVEQLRKEKSSYTVHKTVGVLRSFYSLLEADDIVIKNPVAHLSLPKLDKENIKRPHLNRTQFCDLLEYAKSRSVRDELIVLLLGIMGLRVTEMCNLNVSDTECYIDGYRLLEFTGKGEKKASLPIPVMVGRVLEKHLEESLEDGPLILNKFGNRFNRSGVSQLVKRMTLEAGVPSVTSHALRRSMVTNSLNAGADIREVQKAARHSDIRTTSRIYDQGTTSHDSSSLNVLAGFISGAI